MTIVNCGCLAGCMTIISGASLPDQRPLGRDLTPAPVIPQHRGSIPAVGPVPVSREDNANLTLRTVLSRVLLYSPVLKGATAELRAREAEQLQSGLLPNPEINSDIENFSGSGPYSNFRNTETTIQLSQLIEIGGDRHARIQSAAVQGKLAGWDYEALRLNVLTAATNQFIEVLAGQMRTDLSGQLLKLTQELQAATAKRVAAGKSPPVDLTRAEIMVAQARAQLEQDRIQLNTARYNLALLWGSETADFQKVTGAFPAGITVPAAARLAPYLRDNPAVARRADEIELRRADLALARAKAIPDISVGIGGRRFETTGDNAVVATVSVPLPLFDRNQGTIAAASRRVDKADYDQRSAEDRLSAEFAATYGRLSAAAGRLKDLNSSILPKSQSVFDAVSTGYREGKFDLLNLLDAQRSLFEIKLNTVEVQADFMKAKTELEGLIGRSLESVSPAHEKRQETDN